MDKAIHQHESLKINQPSASRHLNIMRKSAVLQRNQIGGDTFIVYVKMTYKWTVLNAVL
jgi:hypothetical protein